VFQVWRHKAGFAASSLEVSNVVSITNIAMCVGVIGRMGIDEVRKWMT
jgi:hypothetical protein